MGNGRGREEHLGVGCGGWWQTCGAGGCVFRAGLHFAGLRRGLSTLPRRCDDVTSPMII